MGILRLLLALAVVAQHCGALWKFGFVGGQTAVQSFYVISGFYMSLILNEKYIGENKSFKLFITNRFLRLAPIYWVILLATILVSVAIALVTKGHSFGSFDSYAMVTPSFFSFVYLIFTNLLIFGQDIVMFLGINTHTGALYFVEDFRRTNPPLYSFLVIPQAWTLGLELTFYLIAPFILRKGIRIVVILIFISFCLRLFIYNYLGLQNDPWTYRFFPTEIVFFLLGYISYRIYVKIKRYSIHQYINISLLVFIIVLTTLYPKFSSYKVAYLPFLAKELVYFIIVILSIPFLFNFLKRNKLDNKIGELSYPVYISHMLVAMVCDRVSFAFFKSGLGIAIVTVILSYLLIKFITDPVEKYRQSRLAK